MLDVIQKELDIVGAGIKFNSIEELSAWSKEHPQWYTEYEFATKEQFLEWREYFYNHFYDWQPKRVNAKQREDEFRWFNMQYGLKYGFDYHELYTDDNTGYVQ